MGVFQLVSWNDSVETDMLCSYSEFIVLYILLLLCDDNSPQVYEEGGISTSRPGTDPIHDQVRTVTLFSELFRQTTKRHLRLRIFLLFV